MSVPKITIFCIAILLSLFGSKFALEDTPSEVCRNKFNLTGLQRSVKITVIENETCQVFYEDHLMKNLEFSWLKNGKDVSNSSVSYKKDGISCSEFSLQASRSDETLEVTGFIFGKVHSSLKIEVELSVLYKPDVVVKTHCNDAKEGDDCDLSCEVKGKPFPKEVSWYRNGKYYKKTTVNTHYERAPLKLENISWDKSGNYTCKAFNTVGNSTSEPFLLMVKYPPKANLDPQILPVTDEGEALSISCNITAYPPPTCRWWLANSTEDLPDTSETINYVVHNASFIHDLRCLCKNEIGNQQNKHVFKLKPKLKGCQVKISLNVNHHLTCTTGWEVGSRLSFTAKVFDSSNGSLMFEQTNVSSPNFDLKGLKPGQTYNITVNASGIIPYSFIYDNKERIVNGERIIWKEEGVWIAIVVAAIFVMAIIVGVSWKSHKKCNATDNAVEIPMT